MCLLEPLQEHGDINSSSSSLSKQNLQIDSDDAIIEYWQLIRGIRLRESGVVLGWQKNQSKDAASDKPRKLTIKTLKTLLLVLHTYAPKDMEKGLERGVECSFCISTNKKCSCNV